MTSTLNKFEALFQTAAPCPPKVLAHLPMCIADMPTQFAVIDCVVENGADALMITLPFSDPCADSPTMALCAQNALKQNLRISTCFDTIKQCRRKFPDLPIALRTYLNVACAPGIEQFFEHCAQTGVDALHFVDLPSSMRTPKSPFVELSERFGIALIGSIPTETISDEQLRKIALHSQGFIVLEQNTVPTTKLSEHKIAFVGQIDQLHSIDTLRPPLLSGYIVTEPFAQCLCQYKDEPLTLISEIQALTQEVSNQLKSLSRI